MSKGMFSPGFGPCLFQMFQEEWNQRRRLAHMSKDFLSHVLAHANSKFPREKNVIL